SPSSAETRGGPSGSERNATGRVGIAIIIPPAMSPRAVLAALVLSASLAALPRVASAQTTIPGGSLSGAQTWTPAGSPYLVQGDVTIPAGASLEIQPGVEVRIATSDGQAAGTDPT